MTPPDSDVPAGFAPANFSPGFLDLAGPYFLKTDAKPPIVGCRVLPQHRNYLEMAHGGMLATMADVALSWAVYASEDPPLPVSTVSMTTQFLGPARVGDWLEAIGHIDRIGKTLAYVHGSILCGERCLMTMSAVFHVARARPV